MAGLLDSLINGSIVDLRSGIRWTPADLAREAAGRARRLKEAGAGPGKTVLLAHANSPQAIADLLAIWGAGALAGALAPSLTRPEIQNLEAFCRPAAIVAGDGFPHPADAFSSPVVTLGEGSGDGDDFKIALGRDDPALMLFTSGTTGTPKGVVHTRASLEAKISANIEVVSREGYRRALCVLSSHFVAGLVASILSPLGAGGKVFLFPNPGIQGAGQIGKLIDDHAITMVNTVPSFWRMVLKASPPPAKKSLEFVGVASSPLDPETWGRVMAWAGTKNVWNMYGTTETGGWNIGISGSTANPEQGLIGFPIATEAAVRTASGKVVHEGEGEILLKGPSLMKGYFGRPDLTAASIKDGWFATGDLGKISPAGAVSIAGRLNSVINRAGVKVVPEEVEALLESHRDVAEACVFSLPDAISGETVAAAIVLEKGAAIDSQALRDWCKTHIRQECIPETWFRVEKISRTANGKLDRAATRDICRGQKN